MKTLFHILAVLVLLAALFFGYQLKGKYETQLALTKDTRDRISVVSKDIDKKKTARDNAEEVRKTAFAKNAETSEGLKVEQSKLGELNRSLAQVEAREEEAQAGLDKVNQLLIATREKFPGMTIEGLPAEIKRLNDQENAMKRQLEELELLADKLDKKVAKTKTEIIREQGILTDSKKRVGQNDFEATVSTVNERWGFVTIGAGASSGLTGRTKLLVKRGGRLIGKLAISSLESNVAIAEVIPGSLAPGARVLPGDRVILAETVAN